MVTGVARGAMITSLAQGLAATIGFLILGTPSAFLLGFVSMLLSVIPLLGTALVWGPACVYYFWSGSALKGAFLLVWSIAVTGSIDNFLRPWLIGSRENIPFFWLFFSIVGGLQVFGLFGVLLGPLAIAVLTILLDIYRQAYLPPSSHSR
jgi:predicted PurR-regulated permease PerM